MRFSKRTDWPRIQNRLAQVLEEKKKSGVPLLDLTESNPTRCEFDYLTPELLKALADPRSLAYDPDPHGLLTARKKVCEYYAEKNIQVHPNQIFLTASTSEAYSLLFRLLCDPDDQVLVPRPSYPLLDYLSDLNDVKPVFYDLEYQNQWRIRTDSFPKHFFKTKAVVRVHPNNPTGNYVTAEESSFMAEMCKRNQCAIISDEVFFDYSWSDAGQEAKSFAGCTDTLSFTLSGLSKMMGLPQMKLGWIVVNGPQKEKEEAIQRLEVIADTYLSVNTPVQNAWPFWFRDHKAILGEILGRCKRNRTVLGQMLGQNTRMRLLESEGGWYAMLSLSGSVTDEALVIKLLEEYNLVLYPGYFFNGKNDKEVVLSLLPPERVFQEGVARLLKGL